MSINPKMHNAGMKHLVGIAPPTAIPMMAATRRRDSIFLSNVPDHLPSLAFGTKGCSAADMPKVPKAWELGQSAR
jgi:hypothetical protein